VRRLTQLAVMNVLLLICAVSCAQSSAPVADQAVARFGDQSVSAAQLKELVGARTLQLENQMYREKVGALERYIFDQLVAAEAKAKGLTPEDYLKAEVAGKVPEPPVEQVDQIFNQYRKQLPPDDAQARQEVTNYLKSQKENEMRAELQRRLFASSKVSILLDPPRADVKVESWNPTQGPADAPVTLIEFTDFQCPFCGRVQPTLTDLMKRYDGKVRHVFRQLPLPMHQQARPAAEASLCAQDQGKFWQIHDWMFQNQKDLSREAIEKQATELGLDMERFRACLDNKQHADHVEVDAKAAGSVGITGTPGFLVNGRLVTGAQPLPEFVALIDDELRRAGVAVPEAAAAAAPTSN
jgi:protein-disulfide isomerase